MRKIIKETIITLAIFAASFLILAQVPWTKIFRVEQIRENTQKKLGDIYWSYFKLNSTVSSDSLLISRVDSITKVVCSFDSTFYSKVQLHIIETSDVNAFALPDNHLVINTGLINFCNSDDELAGIIAHEIAHMELNHVMQKLAKEIGIATIISISSGSAGEMVMQTARLFTSGAYDRKLEKEADLEAVKILNKAGINQNGLANFMERLSSKEDNFEIVEWLSTHPDSKERAKYIRDAKQDSTLVIK